MRTRLRSFFNVYGNIRHDWKHCFSNFIKIMLSDIKCIVTKTQSSYLTQYRAEISISIRASIVQGQGFLCPQSDFEDWEMLFYICMCLPHTGILKQVGDIEEGGALFHTLTPNQPILEALDEKSDLQKIIFRFLMGGHSFGINTEIQVTYQRQNCFLDRLLTVTHQPHPCVCMSKYEHYKLHRKSGGNGPSTLGTSCFSKFKTMQHC